MTRFAFSSAFLLFAALMASLLSFPADSAAKASPALRIGIVANLSRRTGSDLVSTAARLRQAGVQYTKEDVNWDLIEPRRGVFTWSATDAWMSVAARQGLHVIAVPWSSPRWATPNWNIAPTSGRALSDYVEFVRQVVERYGTQGTFWAQNPLVPKVPIEYYDIWNEPYCNRFWGGVFPDPAGYARMFKSVVAGARPADPNAKFLLEADTGAYTKTWPEPPFLSAMFDAVPDLASYAYAVSVHPYSDDGPQTCTALSPSRGVNNDWKATRFQVCRLEDVRRILDAHRASKVRIWITEIGWSTAPAATKAVTEAAQAQYVHETFRLLRTSWARLVDGVVWYAYQTPERDPTNREDYFGLVHADGSPKPAWNAFVQEIAPGL
jgi:hypothetical protein